MKTLRELPSTGGGPPILVGGGRAISLKREVPPAPFTITLAITAEAAKAGQEVLARVRDACADDNFDILSSLWLLFESATARTPEFHALMDELVREDRIEDIGKILRVPGTRGPKRKDEFLLVAYIEHVMETERIEQATVAIGRLAEIFDEDRKNPSNSASPFPFLPSKKALQNRHASLHELFRLWRNSIYIPSELITATPWRPPGYQPAPSKLVMTKLSNAIVFHAPEDTVTEPPNPKKEK